MIRAYIRNYTTTTPTSRRDGEAPQVELTDRLTSAQWMTSTSAPYERALISLEIRINELDVLGLGAPRAGYLPALHCSGWLELREDEEVLFFGPVTRLSTGLTVAENGGRKSQAITLEASSWVSIVSRPFRLTSNDAISNRAGLYDYDTWSRLFDAVFASGAVVDVAEGLKNAWESLVTFTTPTGTPLNEYTVLVDRADVVSRALPRALERVKGVNLTQVPTQSGGSLWSTFTQTFAPTPELIELYPIRENGVPFLLYRLKPLPPQVVSGYFGADDRREDGEDLPTAHRAGTYQEIKRVINYSLTYRDLRNNYIEVTSPYLGISQLAGQNSAPYSAGDDQERYGLHALEISYPLINGSAGTIREQLEELTTYATALYSEGNAYATAQVDATYQEGLRVGEWARWFDYLEGEGSILVGYVTQVSHKLNIDHQGRAVRRSSVLLERVSQYGRPSAKTLTTNDTTAEGRVVVELMSYEEALAKYGGGE
jgi:hypothetical protein